MSTDFLRAKHISGDAEDGTYDAIASGNTVVVKKPHLTLSTEEVYVKGINVPCTVIASHGYYYVDFSRRPKPDRAKVLIKLNPEDEAQLVAIQLPKYGTYAGLRSGYICKFDVEGITFNVRTQDGVRGFNSKCTVHVCRDGIFVLKG